MLTYILGPGKEKVYQSCLSQEISKQVRTLKYLILEFDNWKKKILILHVKKKSKNGDMFMDLNVKLKGLELFFFLLLLMNHFTKMKKKKKSKKKMCHFNENE
jgi:hypothetical protein